MKKLVLGIAVLLAALLGVVAMQPSEFHIERSALVPASPEVAFGLVNDFHAWTVWNPFSKDDPAQKEEYSGAPAGLGAVMGWKGDKTGEGRMTIENSEPPKSLAIKLEFFKPFEGTNHVVFSFAPQAAGTKVTWAMDGTNAFGAKAAGLVMNMDKMLGAKFDQGLADLSTAAAAEMTKRAAEKAAAEQAALAAAAAAAAAGAPPPAAGTP